MSQKQIQLKEPLDYKKKLKLNPEDFAILYITDMDSRSEALEMLNVFFTFCVQHKNTKIIMPGTGKCKNKIERDALKRVLGSKMIFPGALTHQEILDFIYASDAFIYLQSQFLHSPILVLEALLQGKFVIGSKFSALAELLESESEKNDLRLLVRQKEKDIILKTLLNMINQKSSAKEIAHKIREKSIKLLNQEKLLDVTLKAYYS